MFRELTEKGHEVIVVSSPGKDLEEIAERESVRTVSVPMERRISPTKDLLALWRLIKLFRKEKPDIVHSFTPKAGLLSMVAAFITRIPHRIHTFTGLVFPTTTGLKKVILKATDSMTCRFATHVHAEGEGVRKDLLSNKITKKPVDILANGSLNGVDVGYFNPELQDVKEQAQILIRNDVFTFLFIGRVGADKGINELVEAFQKVQKNYPKTRLILLGWWENDLDPLHPTTINAVEANDAIEYAGVASDVRPWLAASDCLVLPSYREGFPNSVLEAGAMELPVIVTDINGSNEIVVDHDTGLIVSPKESVALASAMQELLDRKCDARAMGKRGRERIMSLYDRRIVHSKLFSFYDTL